MQAMEYLKIKIYQNLHVLKDDSEKFKRIICTKHYLFYFKEKLADCRNIMMCFPVRLARAYKLNRLLGHHMLHMGIDEFIKKLLTNLKSR